MALAVVHAGAEEKECSASFSILRTKLVWQTFIGLTTKLNVAHC